MVPLVSLYDGEAPRGAVSASRLLRGSLAHFCSLAASGPSSSLALIKITTVSTLQKSNLLSFPTSATTHPLPRRPSQPQPLIVRPSPRSSPASQPLNSLHQQLQASTSRPGMDTHSSLPTPRSIALGPPLLHLRPITHHPARSTSKCASPSSFLHQMKMDRTSVSNACFVGSRLKRLGAEIASLRISLQRVVTRVWRLSYPARKSKKKRSRMNGLSLLWHLASRLSTMPTPRSQDRHHTRASPIALRYV